MTAPPATASGATATAGFGNVFARESRRWWTTRRWWTQALLWTGLLNGLLLSFLWIAEVADTTEGMSTTVVGVDQVWPQYIPIAVVLSTVGVVVLTQGVLLDERRSGVLRWVLTKPVSRGAFLLAKFCAQVLPVLVVLVVVPWTGLYVVLSAQVDGWWPAGQFLAVGGTVALLLTFTVALTLLFGTATTSRGMVIGVPIAAVMLYDGVHVLAEDLAGRLPFPWEATTSAVQMATGGSLTSPVPLVATVVWTAVAVWAAWWWFRREEF